MRPTLVKRQLIEEKPGEDVSESIHMHRKAVRTYHDRGKNSREDEK